MNFCCFVALDDAGNLTSPLGMQMAEFPLPPMFAKMLLISGKLGTKKGEQNITVFKNVCHGTFSLCTVILIIEERN